MSRHHKNLGQYKANRLIVLARDPICVYCRGAQSVEADHIIAVSNGGTDDVDNLVGSCKRCNVKKSNKEVVVTTWLSTKWFD